MHFKYKRYLYSQEHQDWLTNPDHLRMQAHLGLAERCAMFHRWFPDMRLSVSKIREIYKEHMVRRKFLREQKLVTRPHLRKINAAAREAHEQLLEKKDQGFSIIYLDEVCFTKTTIPKLAWSAVRHNIELDPKQYDGGCYAVVAAISFCRGLELV